MTRLKLPKNSTSLTLYQQSIYPTEKCPQSPECSTGGHHSRQGAQLFLWWRYRVQKEALCPHKEPREWLLKELQSGSSPRFSEPYKSILQGCSHFLLTWKGMASGGRGLAFLALMISHNHRMVGIRRDV